VSKTAVSLVLSGTADRVGLSAATRERVLAAAAALDYTPNHAAQSLRRRRTNTIVYVTRDLGNPYVAEVVAAVQRAAEARDYAVTVIVAPTDEAEPQTVSRLRAGVCDGLLMTGGCFRTAAELRQLMARGTSCVLLQDACNEPSMPCVRADLQEGARRAVQHLIALGHRRIAHVTDSGRSAERGNDRLFGYRAALNQAGISFDREMIVAAENSLAGGAEAIHTLMQSGRPRPSAVFMFNDHMAAGGLHAMRALGLRVPEDVALVGFDGIALGAFTDPTLTTVEHPREALGRLAAQTLLDLLDGKQPPLIQTLPVRLVIRQSCGARHNPSQTT
jgi:DNA-binding LacI/PurR family transcriptional regulator